VQMAGSVITLLSWVSQASLFLARWLLRPALDLWRKQTGRKLNINIHPWAMPGPGQSVKMA